MIEKIELGIWIELGILCAALYAQYRAIRSANKKKFDKKADVVELNKVSECLNKKADREYVDTKILDLKEGQDRTHDSIKIIQDDIKKILLLLGATK